MFGDGYMNMSESECRTALKIATLTAWAKIMYAEGKINLQQYTSMVQKFNSKT